MEQQVMPSDDQSNPQKSVLTFDYVKSNQFRVIHVSGVHGSVTIGRSELVLGMFNERPPLLKREVFELNSDGSLAGKSKEKRDCDYVREIEVCAIMDVATATAMHNWLSRALKMLKDGDTTGKAHEE